VSYSSTILADNPLAYYRLGANANDSSGHAHNGTATGVTFGATSGIDDADLAAAFDGTTSRVYTTSFNPWSGSVTVEAWVKTTAYATGANKCIVGSDLANPQLVITATGAVNFGYSGIFSAGWPSVWGNVVGDGRWAHLVCTFDPTTINNCHLYINGIDLGAPSSAPGAYGTAGNFTIGARNATPTSFLPGGLDEVAIYSGILSASRARAHYTAGVGALRPTFTAIENLSPALHWRLNEAAGGTLYDSSGNGRLGTANGSVSYAVADGLPDASQAMTLDGSTAYLTSNSYDPFTQNAQRTYLFYVKRNASQSGIKVCFSGKGTLNPGVSDDMKLPVLEFSGDNLGIRWYSSVNRDFPIYQDWPVGFAANTKYLVALRHDDSVATGGALASALTLFVNGVNFGPPTSGPVGGVAGTYKKLEAAGQGLYVGVRPNTLGATSTEFNNGTFGHFAVFNRLLADSEIAGVASAAGLAPPPAPDSDGRTGGTPPGKRTGGTPAAKVTGGTPT
jgi:hypothetical protein